MRPCGVQAFVLDGAVIGDERVAAVLGHVGGEDGLRGGIDGGGEGGGEGEDAGDECRGTARLIGGGTGAPGGAA